MPRYRSVLFDCDSTLSSIEGIEVLAKSHGEEVARLTEAAMRGEVALEQVYGRRLALVRPTRASLDALGREYVDALVSDALEVVRALQAAGVDVRIISGGLLPAVEAVARALGVRAEAVAAVDVRFDARGNYAGFDELSPLARAGGKREVIERWRESLAAPVMLVGDGATDLEAQAVVDCFVAFAGVVARAPVVEAADIVVRAPSLAPILPLALGDDPPADPIFRAIFMKGLSLLDARNRALDSDRSSTNP
jgi:phosphoserine phosphatase